MTWVANRANKFKELLKSPDKFKIATVNKESAKAFKSSGYKVTKTGKAIIPKKGFDKVTVRNGTVIFEGVNPSTGKSIKETVTLATSKDFHDKLLGLSKRKLKKNEMLTVKIGDHAAFNARFQNYSDLFHYVQNVFTPKDNGARKEDLVRQMSIVEISSERNINVETRTKKADKKAKFNRRN